MRYAWWLLILALIACGEDKPKSPKVRKISVTVTTAIVRDVEVWEPAVGWLEAVDQPMVAAEVSGKVAAILADVGDAVQAGQALARIDAEDYRLAASWRGLTSPAWRLCIKPSGLRSKDCER